MIRQVAATAVVVALAAACSGEPSTEEFCGQVDATLEAGPLFPDRTDGEPIPDPDALDALEGLVDAAPGAIEDDVRTLVAEAQALVADADSRQGDAQGDEGSGTTSPTHPPRADVDAAQARVSDYVADQCGVDVDASG